MEERNIYWGREQIYTKELDRLEKAEISEKNKGLIKEFHGDLFAKQCGKLRVSKLSSQLRLLCKWLQTPLDSLTVQEIQALLIRINTLERWSNETKKDYRRVLKQYCCFKFGVRTELIDHIKIGYKKKKQVARDLVQEEDVIKVIDAIRSEKDKAFIFMLYETGARIGEFLNIRIRDIVREGNITKVRLFGKTGERRVIIHSCIPYLFDYLNKHPFKDNPMSYLWLGSSYRYKDKPIVYTGVVKLLKRCFTKAGLPQKRVNPHNFRHSRATALAKSLTEVQLCLFFGWIIGSKQVSTYVHASGRDLDEALCREYGIRTKEEDKSKILPKKCGVCGLDNGCTNSYCSQCGTPLSIKVAIESQEKIKEATDEGIQMLMKIAQDEEMMTRFKEFVGRIN
jgi:integrase/recombinase XerD